MKFTKMQGAGNDYVYVNGFVEQIENPAKLATAISDRHFGIGSDGLVLILPSETCDFRMRMAKIVEGGISEPDSVKIRHIVLRDTQSKLADSLISVIKGGGNFAALAQKYSQLPQTAANGGEIGWVREAGLLQNGFKQDLVTKIFRSGVNEITLDKQTSSIQIIQVETKTQNISKVKLAFLALKVVPSDQTREVVYNQAKEFASAANTSAKFDQAAKAKGIVIHPANGIDPNAPRLGNVKNTRTVFRWANDASAGTTSDVFECGERNEVLIIANLVASHQKGYRDIQEVTPELKAELINDKKAELITKNMLAWNGEKTTSDYNAPIKTYEDHRMAMAFAPAALIHPIKMEHPEVVSKSYPRFWNDLQSVGFIIE